MFANIDDETIMKLRERYSHLHPLLFLRSLEKTDNLSDLFDILETVPDEYPLVWNKETRRWVSSSLTGC